MLKELAEVSNRHKFKNIFTSQRMKELFSLLDNYAIVVSPSQKVNACRDEKDNFLLEVALEGRADYLITGDEDLLVLNTFQSTKIIRPKEFEDMFKSEKG
jgi:putative PIN family toxin of toxin-antitoxin system